MATEGLKDLTEEVGRLSLATEKKQVNGDTVDTNGLATQDTHTGKKDGRRRRGREKDQPTTLLNGHGTTTTGQAVNGQNTETTIWDIHSQSVSTTTYLPPHRRAKRTTHSKTTPQSQHINTASHSTYHLSSQSSRINHSISSFQESRLVQVR